VRVVEIGELAAFDMPRAPSPCPLPEGEGSTGAGETKMRSPRFAAPDIEVEQRRDGSRVLRSRQALLPYPDRIGEWLEHWAGVAPGRVFLAERDGAGGWRRVTYGAALEAARAIGSALVARGLSAERPVVILSENGIDHALLTLGALHVGVPAVPVSVAYSRLSQDFAKLRHIMALVRPGLVYARDGGAFAAALAALDPADAELVVSVNPPRDRAATAFADLVATPPSAAGDAAHAATGPDTVAKILFTSGSTGLPKGVINTQRMLCANQQMIAQLWPFLATRPPVIVDWLPWNHTFGGNHNFNLVLRHGGTLHIDDSKPAPGLIERSLTTLREISPTLYFNVPLGFAMLVEHLERDDALARNFFRDLDFLFYAAASLPQPIWERLERVSRKARGDMVPMVSAWGATETAPMATAVHFPMARAGNIGLPPPGAELKLVKQGDRLEMRVRGPHVTPGYWRHPELGAAIFDDEGFFLTGDAGRFEDETAPARGIVFDGRLAENFKLTSGIWVAVGALRVAAIAACAPLVADAVIAGHDRDAIGLLLFPNIAACRALCPALPGDAAIGDILARPEVRDAVAAGLRHHNDTAQGSSTRIARALLLAEPPSIDANEITDKGYINQRAVLARRAALVEALYGEKAVVEIVIL
jgi:feruloyl-CoA synthase